MSEVRSLHRRHGGRAVARAAAVVVMATTLIAALGVPVQATYYSGGMPSRTFNYRTHGINDTWVGFYDTGNIRWNQRVNSRIGRSTSAAADATAGSYSASWYGEYDPHGVRGVNRTFTIRMNSRTINLDYSTSRRPTAIPAFITHELGHALSLADNPNTTRSSIMKYSDVTPLRVLVPQPYDIEEVERIY
jgi:hypothetical protein